MKFLENYEQHKKRIKDNYMFSKVHEDDKGNLLGVCNFCKKAGIEKEVDMAEHTNNCPNINGKS